MNKPSRFLCSAVCFGLASLIGCGSAPNGPAISAAGLAGNWLIVGSLPVFPASLTYLNHALTIDVNNGQVSASGTLGVSCTGTESDSFLTFLPAQVSSDGKFTLQTDPSTLPTVKITGTAPTSGSNCWSGAYVVTSGACGVQSAGFTATPIRNLTGTYNGPATFSTPPPPGSGTPTLTPVTISAVFQQGGMNATTGLASSELLTGTISVQGMPCFTTGTMSTINGTAASVKGTSVIAPFKMNDGSLLVVEGFVTDTGATKFSVQSAQVDGGTCGNLSAFQVELNEQ